MDLASILVCGLAFVTGDYIDITHLLRLRVTLNDAIAFCVENPCTPGIVERIEHFEACESAHVEELMGLDGPVDAVVIQRGDRYYIER